MFFSRKILILTCCLPVVFPQELYLVRGGPRELNGDALKNAENELKTSLSKLATGDDPVYYEIEKVHSGTIQIVTLMNLTTLNVDLINNSKEKKNCNVSIWDRVWLQNYIEVSIECEGENKIERKHNV